MKNKYIVAIYITIMTIFLSACTSSNSANDKYAHKDEFEAIEYNSSTSDIYTEENDSTDEDSSIEDDKSYEEKMEEAQYVIDNIDEVMDTYEESASNIDTSNNKNSNEMLIDEYASNYDDSTTKIDNIDIDKSYDIDEDIYNKIELEISALAELNSCTYVESIVSEYNENGGFITYVAKYDNNTYYYITAFIDKSASEYGQLITMPDNGYAASAFEESDTNIGE